MPRVEAIDTVVGAGPHVGKDMGGEARRRSGNGGVGVFLRWADQGSPRSAESGSNQYSRPPWWSSSRNQLSKLVAITLGGLCTWSSPEVKIGQSPPGQ